MINLALKYGVGVAVVVCLATVLGILSLFRVPVQLTPDLSQTTVSVLTSWPGATPQDIEKEIVIEQERFLRGLPDLDKMTSEASTGRAEVVLEFRVGVELDEVLVKVQNALSQVPSYPENVDQPRIVTTSASDEPIAWFSVKPLPGNPQNIDIIGQQDFLEDYVKTELERVAGVSQSEIFGGSPRALNIFVDPARLAERNISIRELRAALRARNRDVSGGDFDEGKRRYLIRTIGRFHSAEDVENTLIAWREGAPVYLRDVGYAEMGYSEVRARVRNQGEPSLAMNVRRQPGTNTLEVMDAVKERVIRINENILNPNGMYIRQVSDNTIYIKEAVDLVRGNLILGACLVTLVLLLFLRSFKTTFIGAMAVPICTVCSFLGLTLTGRTINVISLAGIAFAIGMTVDNSIVVLENIDRHRKMGKSAFNAARDGVKEVWSAVLASTLTTIIVFLPIVFVEEEAGQLFRDIAIAISAAIFFSMLSAITVIPSASSRMLSLHNDNKHGLSRQFDELFGLVPIAQKGAAAFVGFIRWLMGGVMRRVVLVSTFAVASIAMAFLLMPKTEYLPSGNRNLLFAYILPPPGYNVDEMTEIGKQVENEFMPYVKADPARYEDGIDDVPALDEFFFISTPKFLLVITRPVDKDYINDVKDILNARLGQVPGMIPFTTQPSIFGRSLGGTRGIDVDVQGRDLADIFDTAAETFGRIGGAGIAPFQGGIRPEPGLNLGQPLLQIRPDWERAASLGIDVGDLGYMVWALSDGAWMDEFYLADDKIDMYLHSTQGTVDRTQDLENLLLYTPSGRTVPLSSVAEVVETVNTESIRRVDGQRTVSLTVVPQEEIPLETAVERLDDEIIGAMREQGAIPLGVNMRIAGASDKLQATREALGGNFILAAIITYLLMVALFSHWGYPLVIMMSLPLGIVGGMAGLWLMNHGGDLLGWTGLPIHNINQPLDVLTMLGFVVLIGTVVNNPILLVETTLQLIRDEDYDILDAVVESTKNRLRPIMMSSISTTFGLAPLVFLPGSGAELYRGLGTVALFGLFFSTIFTLTFIPSLLSLFLQTGVVVKKTHEKVRESLSKTAVGKLTGADLIPSAGGNGARDAEKEPENVG